MKKIILAIFLLFLTINISFWYNDLELKVYYNKLYLKIEKVKKDEKSILNTLELLSKNLDKAIQSTKNTKNLYILNTLKNLNTKKLEELKTLKINLPFVNELINNWYRYVEVSNNFEFSEKWEIYKIIFTTYYKVDEESYQYFIKNKINNWYLIKYKNEFFIVWKYSLEKKYLYEELKNIFSNYYDLENPYLLNNWVYYSYNFSKYLFFEDSAWVYLSDLENNKIDIKNTLFIKDKNKYYFSNDYKKLRLVWENIISNISNKNEFLYNIADDNKFFQANYDKELESIRNITTQIISSVSSDEEKIKIIYNWVIDNISYYKDFRNSDNQVYSWILTFKNKTWVCDWYTKLFSYMLSFAWVKDVETKRWFVFDSLDFPAFWHAWVRVWDKYYDPTFDDPIWPIWLNGNNEFYYFALPYDLMYSNRFDWKEIPKNLYILSLNNRKNLVNKNLYNLYEKYKDYPLMYKVKNKIFLWLSYDENITLEKLSKKLPFYEVINNSYIDNWVKKNIKSLNYYNLTQENLETVIINPKVNLENMVLLKWINKNQEVEYRLAYDLKFF